MREQQKEELVAEIHRGLPNAQVEFDEVLNIKLGGEQALTENPEAAPRESMRISLDKLKVNVHNQSFGIISASTGCISNPGGPSC